MSFIFSLKRKNLPFSLINNNNFALPESVIKKDCIMWPEINALSLSNLLKEVS